MPKREKDSTNLMILFLSFSNIVGNALTIISGIFIARWLLPAELGFFNGFTLLVGYIILAQAGIPSGLGRELPLYLGRGDSDKALKYAAVAQCWQIILCTIIMAFCILAAIFFLAERKYEYAAGTFVVGLLSFQALYVTKYLKVLYRTNSDFNRLSQIGLIVSFTSFVSIVFVWKYGFYGLCARAFVLVVADLFFTWKWRPIDVRPAWDSISFLELIKIGLPMFCIANIYGLWPLLQRTLIITLGGARSLGLYAVAIMVDNAMKTITGAISNVTYPKMVTEWGNGAAVSTIVKINFKPLLWSFLLFLVAVPMGWILLPHVVPRVLPNYMEGLSAAQWMLLAGLMGSFTALGNVYNVVRKQRDRLVYFMCGVGSWLLAVFCLYSINGFMLDIFPKAMCIGLAVMLVVNLLYIRRYCRMDLKTF